MNAEAIYVESLTKREYLAVAIYERLVDDGENGDRAAAIADGVLTDPPKRVDKAWTNWIERCPRCFGEGEIQRGVGEMGEPIYALCPLCQPLYHPTVDDDDNGVPF